jgi:pimeloyl-ACP methyl ester carboxylesterase
MNERTVEVTGGLLWYRAQGTGPALILMGGGPSNADTLEPLAARLADDFTVVTYDRRGYSRSHTSDPVAPAGPAAPAAPAAPAEPTGIQLHADDARRLIAQLGSGPVAVFGTSFGALIALELAATVPTALGALIVHEPPLGQLLAGDDRQPFDLNLDAEKDPAAALNAIAASVGVSRGRPAGPGVGTGPGANPADIALFIRRDAPAIGDYHLDLDRLRPLVGRITVAGSRESRGFYPYRCAEALAHHLDFQLAELPGNHAGMIRHPAEFAARLRALLPAQRALTA